MGREKHIVEMADDVRKIRESYFGKSDHLFAMKLYEDGYRKTADVAEEIFAEIEKAISSMKYNVKTKRKTIKIEELKEQVDWVLHEVVPNRLAELKKKYTEDGE